MVEDIIYGITQFLFIEIYLSSSESEAKKYFLSPGQICILPFISSPKKCVILVSLFALAARILRPKFLSQLQ